MPPTSGAEGSAWGLERDRDHLALDQAVRQEPALLVITEAERPTAWLPKTPKKGVTTSIGGRNGRQLSKKNWGMYWFRITALEKLIGSNSFEKDQLEMTAETLIRKISIIVNGAKKRSNRQVFELYNEKKIYWLDQLKK